MAAGMIQRGKWRPRLLSDRRTMNTMHAAKAPTATIESKSAHILCFSCLIDEKLLDKNVDKKSAQNALTMPYGRLHGSDNHKRITQMVAFEVGEIGRRQKIAGRAP